LRNAGMAAAAIHGDRTQAQREQVLAAFRAGSVRALVATDVAARGIHVDDVARVIHYDLPTEVKDYVHRSGRTARAGSDGTVIAFVTPGQESLAASLRRNLNIDDSGKASEAKGAAPSGSPGGPRPANARRRPDKGRTRWAPARSRGDGATGGGGPARGPVRSVGASGSRRQPSGSR